MTTQPELRSSSDLRNDALDSKNDLSPFISHFLLKLQHQLLCLLHSLILAITALADSNPCAKWRVHLYPNTRLSGLLGLGTFALC